MKKLLLFVGACLAAFSISNAATTTTTLEENKDVTISVGDAYGWLPVSWQNTPATVTQEAFLEITFNNTTASGQQFQLTVQSNESPATQNTGTFTVSKPGFVYRLPLTIANIQQIALQNVGAITTEYTENVTVKVISGLTYNTQATTLTTTGDQLLATELSALNDYDKVVITYNASSDWTTTQSGWTEGTINGISLPVTQATNNTLSVYAIDLKAGTDLPFSFWRINGSDETATNASLVSVVAYQLEGTVDTRSSFIMSANAPYNYQSSAIELGLTEAPAINDTIVFTLTNVNVSQDVEGIQVFLVETGTENGNAWNVVSNYGAATALANAKATDAAVGTVTVQVIVENAITYPGIVKAIVSTTNAPVAGIDAVNLLFESKSYEIVKGTSTAINTIENAAFAVEGGMVASAGEIVVYNVAGQVVATASQNFNVNSLAKGVYFITAQEGIIKFVK